MMDYKWQKEENREYLERDTLKILRSLITEAAREDKTLDDVMSELAAAVDLEEWEDHCRYDDSYCVLRIARDDHKTVTGLFVGEAYDEDGHEEVESLAFFDADMLFKGCTAEQQATFLATTK